MDVRVGPERKVNTEELMLSNCGAGEDSWEPPEINPEYSLEGLMLKLKVQYFGHLMQKTDSFEKTLMLGKTESRKGRGDDRGWDDWMASPTWWTWVWASSRRWWRTWKPGVLDSGVAKSQTWLSNWMITTKKQIGACLVGTSPAFAWPRALPPSSALSFLHFCARSSTKVLPPSTSTFSPSPHYAAQHPALYSHCSPEIALSNVTSVNSCWFSSSLLDFSATSLTMPFLKYPLPLVCPWCCSSWGFVHPSDTSFHLLCSQALMEAFFKVLFSVYTPFLVDLGCFLNSDYCIYESDSVNCSVVSESFVTPLTVAHQAPASMGFFRQEYWSG